MATQPIDFSDPRYSVGVTPQETAARRKEAASAASSEATAGRTRALTEPERRKAAAEAEEAEIKLAAAREGAKKKKPPTKEEADYAALLSNMDAAVGTVNLLTQQFNRSLAGKGLTRSTLEYLPSQERGAINSTGAGLADVGLSVFKVPGSGSQSDKDAERFVEANQPSTWDFDYTFLGKLFNLRRRLDAKSKSLGLPPIQWVEPNDASARDYLALPQEERSKIGLREYGSFKDIPPELERTPEDETGAGLAAVPGAAPPPMLPPISSQVDRSAPLPGRTGEAEYGAAQLGGELTVTEVDQRIASQIQQAFDAGASASELRALAKELYAATGSPAQLNEKQLNEAIRYRNNYIKSGGQGPSGATIIPRETPMTSEQLSAVESLNDPARAFLFKTGEALSAGLAPTVTGLFDPAAAERQRLSSKYYGEASPWASFAGDILGTIAPTAALTKGLTLARVAAPRAALGADILYGGTRGATENPDNPLAGAIIGGGTAAAGNVVASKILSPGAELAFSRYLPPKPTFAERTIAGGGIGPIDAAEARLREAIDLGLPYGLADVSTQSQQLGRQTARRSEKGAGAVETLYPERSAERSLRAAEAIERDIAPVVDPVVREQEIEDAAEAAAGHLYDRAIVGRAAPVDDKLDAMLDTTLGREGLRRAYQYAEAKGIDPRSIGFDLDDQANVILVRKPSWDTLHYIRKGLSRKINEYRDPVTRTLDSKNPDVQDYTAFLKRFDRRLDALNPDYALARSTYAQYIKPLDFLRSGLKMADPNVRVTQVQRTLEDIQRMPTATPEQQALQQEALRAFREGYATRLADLTSRVGGGDPYAVAAGSPQLRQKLALVAKDPDRFLRQRGLETQMETTRATTAISPVAQARSEAEASLLEPSLMEAGMETVLTGSPTLSAANLARNVAQSPGVKGKVADMFAFGAPWRARRRAEEISPMLLGTDPETALDVITSSRRAVEQYRGAADPYRAALGLAGGAGAIGGAAAANEEPLYNPAPTPLDPALLATGVYGTGAKIQDDGSVITPDGVVVDPETARRDIMNMAQTLSSYY